MSEEAFIRNVTKRTGNGMMLDSDLPVAEALSFETKPFAAGGESVIFRGSLNLRKLDAEGYRQLVVPILTHRRLRSVETNGAPSALDAWDKKRVIAEELAKDMKKAELEKEVEKTFSQLGLEGKEIDVVLRFGRMPLYVNGRPKKQDLMLGLRDDNIVYHFTQGTTKKNDYPYSVIQLMDGMLTPDYTEGKSAKFYLHALKGIIRGLQRLQELGITHRDLKPDNIFYKGNHGRPEVKLADFGIMKVDGVQFDVRTRTGIAMGTPVYMPPEQLNSKAANWQSDQFSAGAALYEMISGKNPLCDDFQTLDTFDLLSRVKNWKRSRPSIATEKNIQIEAIEQMLARMMQEAPHNRYQSYDDILADIKRAEKGKLPQHANATGLVDTLFKPGEFTNYYTNRKGMYRALVGLAIAAAAGGAVTAARMGCFDKLMPYVEKVKDLF